MGIYAKVADDGGKWVEIGADGGGGELPGVGGWATITAVSGVYTPHRYNDGVTDWVAYEWTDDGTLETQAGGLVDALLVAAGGGGNGPNIGKGLCLDGIREVSTTNSVVVPAGGVVGKWGLPAQLGAHATDTNYHWDTNWPVPMSFTSAITGTNKPYGRHQQPFPTTPNTGDGGDNGVPGASGTVIVRVPAANAQSVAENFHGWDSFALVTDGVVTEVTKVPDNEPRTMDTEWLPCEPEVQVGWGHADGEFTAPPAPTRDDLIADLKAQVKNLQKDK